MNTEYHYWFENKTKHIKQENNMKYITNHKTIMITIQIQQLEWTILMIQFEIHTLIQITINRNLQILEKEKNRHSQNYCSRKQ